MAFGTLAQLALENAPKEEIREVLDFCTAVGLPICLEDIGVDQISQEELLEVAKKACIPEESVYAMPFPVTVESVAAAILTADEIGKSYKAGNF